VGAAFTFRLPVRTFAFQAERVGSTPAMLPWRRRAAPRVTYPAVSEPTSPCPTRRGRPALLPRPAFWPPPAEERRHEPVGVAFVPAQGRHRPAALFVGVAPAKKCPHKGASGRHPFPDAGNALVARANHTPRAEVGCGDNTLAQARSLPESSSTRGQALKLVPMLRAARPVSKPGPKGTNALRAVSKPGTKGTNAFQPVSKPGLESISTLAAVSKPGPRASTLLRQA
jgi:hypothetical protein